MEIICMYWSRVMLLSLRALVRTRISFVISGLGNWSYRYMRPHLPDFTLKVAGAVEVGTLRRAAPREAIADPTVVLGSLCRALSKTRAHGASDRPCTLGCRQTSNSWWCFAARP